MGNNKGLAGWLGSMIRVGFFKLTRVYIDKYLEVSYNYKQDNMQIFK